MSVGIYSDKDIKELISNKTIDSGDPIKEKQIQPSSLDLRIGKGRGYCMPYSSLPCGEKNLEAFLKSNSLYSFGVTDNFFLHKNVVYVIPLQENLNLPEYLFGKSNPKSSTGRTDIHVRLLTEGGRSFDNISPGYKGRLWLEAYSRSFDLEVPPGISLSQLRIFDEGSRILDEKELVSIQKEEGILFNRNSKINGKSIIDYIEEGSIVSINLDLGEDVVGYVAKGNAPPVNLGGIQPRLEYFDEVRARNGEIVIATDSFYVFPSLEVIKVPQDLCAEMADIRTTLGEYRTHYAGFFDPGFRAKANLEVRNFGAPFLLRHGQKIASFVFYRLRRECERSYGEKGLQSHYQGQRVKLAKFFDMDK